MYKMKVKLIAFFHSKTKLEFLLSYFFFFIILLPIILRSLNNEKYFTILIFTLALFPGLNTVNSEIRWHFKSKTKYLSYFQLSIIFTAIDVLSKLLLYNENRIEKQIFLNFELVSKFHYFDNLFVVEKAILGAALFLPLVFMVNFNRKILDRMFSLSAVMYIVSQSIIAVEGLIFSGAHNIINYREYYFMIADLYVFSGLFIINSIIFFAAFMKVESQMLV